MSRFGAKENYFYGCLIYDSPKIIWCKTWSISERVSGATVINPIVNAFSHIDVIWLVSVGWLASDFECRAILDGVHSIAPSHKVIFLVNTYEETNLLRRKNITHMLVNQNQFLNRNEFRPIPDTPKTYHAVYNAGLYNYKRHHLAQKIKDLALIARGSGDAEAIETVKCMEGVHLVNFTSGNYRWQSPEEVNLIYNQSYCGLCLSKTEGAMKACMEYMLSGIPIVTTVNKGGRDYFLDGRFTIWTEDDPNSVAEAVEWLVAEEISAEFIRNETLHKLLQANEMFVRQLSTALGLNENALRSRLDQYSFNISAERSIDEL